MKIGDLVFYHWHEKPGIVVSEPYASKDCLPGGEAHGFEYYELVDVAFSGEIVVCELTDCRIINESR